MIIQRRINIIILWFQVHKSKYYFPVDESVSVEGQQTNIKYQNIDSTFSTISPFDVSSAHQIERKESK